MKSRLLLSSFDSRVREALGFAGALAAVVALCGGALQEIYIRSLEAETKAVAGRSIVENSRWAAEAVQEEIQARIRIVRAVETSLRKPGKETSSVLIEPSAVQSEGVVAAAAVPVATDTAHWMPLELDPEWLAIGAWKMSASSQPIPSVVGVNSRSSDRPGALPERFSNLSPEVSGAIRRALEGETIILGDWKVDPRGLLAIVLPGTESGTILVGWTRTARFQRWFKADRTPQLALLDLNGKTLVDAALFSPTVGGPAAQRNPMWEAARGPEHLRLTHHQDIFQDVSGRVFFGGFYRVGEGQLLVLASVDAQETLAGIQSTRIRGLSVLGLIVGVCFFVAFFADLGVLLGKGKFSFRRRSSAALDAQPAPSNEEPEHEQLVRTPVYLLSAGLSDLVELAEKERPEEIHQTVNDFFVIGRSLAKEFGGRIVPTGGSTWTIYWAAVPGEQVQGLSSVRSALELRRTIASLNEARKVDGHSALRLSMALHCAAECVGMIGEMGARRAQPMGEIFEVVVRLRDLAKGLGLDLLVSDAVRQGMEEVLIAKALGEHRLSAGLGLTAIHALEGYRDESGTEHRVWTSYSGSLEEAEKAAAPSLDSASPVTRWLVNNGSKILGPLDASAMAHALFSQEIDFDSECWREGTGESAQVKSCGLFSVSEDPEANLWVFDGQQLHGPMTRGFLQTALLSGAISEEHSLCEESTVNGWMRIADWKATGAPAESESRAKAA